MYRFLRKDMRGLDNKLAELGAELRKVCEDAALWVNQSSETWHDNFGFEDAERQKHALIKRLDELRAVRAKAEFAPCPKGDTVEVGTKVTVLDQAGAERSFLISSYMVFERTFDDEVSYEAPLAKSLLTHREGDETQIRTPSGFRTVEITSVAVVRSVFQF